MSDRKGVLALPHAGEQDSCHARHGLRLFWALALLVLLAAGCTPARARPAPSPTPALASDRSALPEKNASSLVVPEDGGVVALRDGAEVALPRQSLTGKTMVGLRVRDDAGPAPIPLSLIGRAYDLSLDGGSLVGLAVLTLPLPTGVVPEQYDLAAYRWDGRVWQHVDGRFAGESLRAGINQPGIYAVLGAWRMGDATLALALPAPKPGGTAVRVEVSGQYRFMAPPTLDHEYVQARLILKRDSSGGAGQVQGNDSIDQTLAETPLYFQPDPGRSQGAIDFNYTFQVDPVSLQGPLGSINLFYASLIVADSPAPTRRLSSAATYTLQVPIRAAGTEITRPDLPGNRQALQWHVRLNGQTLLRRPAGESTLSLAEILAQGGLGEYKLTLEAEVQGQFVPVSNEITIQLTLPSTVTPTVAAPTPSTSAVAQNGGPSPFGTMPPTPTRRPQPRGTPNPFEAPTPEGGLPPTDEPGAPDATPGPIGGQPLPGSLTPTPTRETAGGIFWADREALSAGECTTLHWSVQNVAEVYLDGSPTVGVYTQQVCPQATTTYTLHTLDPNGQTQDYRIVVSVAGSSPAAGVIFTADRYRISQGECTTLRWSVTDVNAVYLNDQGVGGVDSREVCPKATTTYELWVLGAEESRTRLTIYVLGASQVAISFWAEQYTLPPGGCTTLHWDVEGVETVHLSEPGSDSGVEGHAKKTVCPSGTQTYKLSVTASDNRNDSKTLQLQAGDVTLGPGEVIAQAIVSDVSEVADIDPNSIGDLRGYIVVVDGVKPLYKGSADCCQNRMTLRLSNALMTAQFATEVDWPVRTGQFIEFRFRKCTDNTCDVFSADRPLYFKVRSN